MTGSKTEREAFEWQLGVWNQISDIYVREIDHRFSPVVEAVIGHAQLAAGESVLDLGTGTGAVAERAAAIVGASGQVVGVDISPDMLAWAQRRIVTHEINNLAIREGSGESIPSDDHSFDVVLCSLTLMYVLDRAAAAREIARVLRPEGRLVAAVWGGPDECDIVFFQQTAGRFAGPPPIPGVGPGALADTTAFLTQLAEAGIEASVETQTLEFEFPNFSSAWNALAGVTTSHLPHDQQLDAQRAVMDAMYPSGDGPRNFKNLTQFIVGQVGR